MNAVTTPSTFLSRLQQCQLLSQDEIQTSISVVGAEERPLTQHLIENGLLTRFQAKQIQNGATSLQIGNYIAVDFIGRGGNGIVFKGRHIHMPDRYVAIKTLDVRNLHRGDEATARFHREIQNISRLNHPNIVQALDVVKVRQQCFLVLEYVEGKDLEKVVRDKGPLPVQEALNYIIQAARGLAYAHKHGIVHRDIKPTNLLLTKNGTVKLSDLGLSRSAQDQKSELTLKGVAIGTPEFMAPEQAEDASSAGPLSDIYSLGATLYHLLTGRLHIEGSTFVHKLQQLLSSEPQPLLKVKPDIDPDLAAVVDQMRARDPKDRPQSAEDVIAILEEFVVEPPKRPTVRKPNPAEMAKLIFAVVKNDRSVSDICAQYRMSEAEFIAEAGALLKNVDRPAPPQPHQNGDEMKKQLQELYSKIGAQAMEIEALKQPSA